MSSIFAVSTMTVRPSRVSLRKRYERRSRAMTTNDVMSIHSLGGVPAGNGEDELLVVFRHLVEDRAQFLGENLQPRPFGRRAARRRRRNARLPPSARCESCRAGCAPFRRGCRSYRSTLETPGGSRATVNEGIAKSAGPCRGKCRGMDHESGDVGECPAARRGAGPESRRRPRLGDLHQGDAGGHPHRRGSRRSRRLHGRPDRQVSDIQRKR